MKTLQQIFDHHSQQVKGEAAYGCGHGDKGTVHSYIPEYERLLSPYREKNIKLLEIGVAYGESLEMWYEYFSKGKIYGADIHTNEIGPYLNDERFNINIVDATNPLIKSYFEGDKFDIIIDDGSHHVNHVNKTFQYLYPKMSKNGIYFVEDTHAAYWKDTHGGGLNEPESIINVSKNLVDKLNADHTRGQVEPDDFTRSTQSITFYDSVIVFERGEIHWKQPLEFPQERALNSAPDMGDFTIKT